MTRAGRFALAAILAVGADRALAAEEPARSVIFRPPPQETLDVIVIEDQRDSLDRKKREKPPTQRFRESLEKAAAPAGVTRWSDGTECLRPTEGARAFCIPPASRLPPEFSRFTPYGAMTAFRSGSTGFGQ